MARSKRKSEHRFLRRIVSWCIVLLTIIVAAVIFTALRAGEQISPTSVAAMLTAIVGELTLTIIKRKDDNKKAKDETAETEKTEIPKNETI